MIDATSEPARPEPDPEIDCTFSDEAIAVFQADLDRPEPPPTVDEALADALAHGSYDEPEPPALLPEEIGIFRVSQVAARRVSWLWQGRIPFGYLTLLEGDPGLGKSTVMLDLIARLTRGRALPGEVGSPEGENAVLLISAEDGAADVIRPRLDAAGADLRHVCLFSQLPPSLGGGLPRFPHHLALLRVLIGLVHPILVVIDPLVAYLDPRLNSHTDQGVRRALAPLAGIAARTGVAIVAIRHLSKRASRNPLYRGGGSIGFIGAARSALLVARDPDDPRGERRVVASAKTNLGPPPAELAFHLSSADNGASAIRWEGAVQHTAASLTVEPDLAGDPGAFAEATTVLAGILADGPRPADEVKRQAAQADLGSSQLRRAKAALGVRSRRFGQPGAAEQGWVWELPPAGRPPEDVGPAANR